MGVKVYMVSPTYVNYNVSGDTLADIWKSIQRIGPVDPADGNHVSYMTIWQVGLEYASIKVQPHGKPKLHKRTGWFEAKAKLKAMTILIYPTIHVPVPTSSKLSKPALKEWGRYATKCQKHETKHLTKTSAECDKIGKVLMKERGIGMAATEADAQKEADVNVRQAIALYFDTDTAIDRVNRMNARFDVRSRHGGAKLDTSIV